MNHALEVHFYVSIRAEAFCRIRHCPTCTNLIRFSFAPAFNWEVSWNARVRSGREWIDALQLTIASPKLPSEHLLVREMFAMFALFGNAHPSV
ncbi:hypothetical protein OG21DRAFT_132811 [Imleria badia]|nr:hypothetical protein OG21DRAFT_132811 [Imleria badia]